MKNRLAILIVLALTVFSGCLTYRDGAPISNKNGLDLKQLAAVLAKGEVTELPKVLERAPQTTDENVMAAFQEEYTAERVDAGNGATKTQYTLNVDSLNQENRRILLEYFNAEIKSLTLDKITGLSGYPALYEYQKNKGRIILYYMYEQITWLFILAPFYIPGWKDYRYYQFVFELSDEDPYHSPLVFFNEFNGKYLPVDMPQPLFNEFLDALIVPGSGS